MKLTEEDISIVEFVDHQEKKILVDTLCPELKRQILENQRLRELVEEQLNLKGDIGTIKGVSLHYFLQSLLDKAKGEK